MSTATAITVINPTEGKRFKMNLKGEILRLSIRKFKKYLAPNCGISESEQVLKYNGVELGDDVLAGEVGISNGSTLTVERRANPGVPFIASPNRHQLELETIDQQRAMLLNERLRRDEELRRQSAGIAQSLAAAEKRRLDLERERQEKDFELARIKELEAQAEQERQRVAAIREAEAERESVRAKDLEARKNQMHAERNAQRQLEMQRLENERKKMLLSQQRSEYESERARLERERAEYYERRRKQELEIREREFELDKQELEAQRVRQELEIEKSVLHEQRNHQYSRVGLDKTQQEPPLLAATAAQQHNSMRRSESRQSEPVINVETHRLNTEERKQHAPSPPKARQFGFGSDITKFVEECLFNLASSLGIPRLTLDDNNTCVVSYDDRYTLLVTFDAATQRLFLYSTLTTTIPRDDASKLKLYEFLMEGALLGRDMCGGGVGASLKNDFILISTSVFLPESSPHCLATITPLFVDSLVKWRNRVRELGFGMEDSVANTSYSRASPAVDGGAGRSYSNDVDGRSQFSTVPSVAQRESRPLIGIEVSDGQMVDGLRHRYYDGVSVIAVHGPAQRAGILPQDFVKAVKNIPVTNLDTFRSVIKNLVPGTSCPFVVDRAGSELTFTVFVGSASD